MILLDLTYVFSFLICDMCGLRCRAAAVPAPEHPRSLIFSAMGAPPELGVVMTSMRISSIFCRSLTISRNLTLQLYLPNSISCKIKELLALFNNAFGFRKVRKHCAWRVRSPAMRNRLNADPPPIHFHILSDSVLLVHLSLITVSV